MCLGVPAKIINIEGDFAQASIEGVTFQIGIQLLEEVKVGDYVLVHTGYALEKLSEEEASETLRMLGELNTLKDRNNIGNL